MWCAPGQHIVRALCPLSENSCYASSHAPFHELRKVMGTSKLLILMPLCCFTSLESNSPLVVRERQTGGTRVVREPGAVNRAHEISLVRSFKAHIIRTARRSLERHNLRRSFAKRSGQHSLMQDLLQN